VIAQAETRPNGSRQTVRTILIAGCDAASLGLLAFLITSRVFYSEFGLGQEFGVDRILLLIVIAGLVVLRRVAARVDPRLTLASLSILVVAGAGVALLPALGVNLIDRIRIAVDPIKSAMFAVLYRERLPAAIYRLDDRYGLVHVPHATDWARGHGFSATYTIDADGHRETPSPAAPRGTVVFLGDSMTFGAGVNDDENYPYVLAARYWTDLRVINAAVDGWGLTQCHLALTDLLSQSPLPTAVILAIIPDDLRRSHLRPPVIRGLQRRLEWIDGKFVPRDLHDGLTDLNVTPELLEAEARLARATIDAMIAQARRHDVAFGLVLLADGGGFPADLTYHLGRAGVATVDLTRLGATTLADGFHPDPGGHRAIAAAIAASPLTSVVYGHPAAGR
jgi:lysophospholipase L1-like esterase